MHIGYLVDIAQTCQLEYSAKILALPAQLKWIINQKFHSNGIQQMSKVFQLIMMIWIFHLRLS